MNNQIMRMHPHFPIIMFVLEVTVVLSFVSNSLCQFQ